MSNEVHFWHTVSTFQAGKIYQMPKRGVAVLFWWTCQHLMSMSVHFKNLTGIDFKEKFTWNLDLKGKKPLDYMTTVCVNKTTRTERSLGKPSEDAGHAEWLLTWCDTDASASDHLLVTATPCSSMFTVRYMSVLTVNKQSSQCKNLWFNTSNYNALTCFYSTGVSSQ